MIPSEVIRAAREEVRQEQFRAAVETEKARLRTKKTLWRRVIDALPFVITRRKP